MPGTARELTCVIIECPRSVEQHVCRFVKRHGSLRVRCSGLTSQIRRTLRDARADGLILDLRLPGAYSLLRSLSDSRPPCVLVGNTDAAAYDAWEFGAVDFVRVPFDDTRIGRAIDRLVARIGHNSVDLASVVAALTLSPRHDEANLAGTGLIALEADGKCVWLHYKDRPAFRLRGTLERAIRELGGGMVRVHPRWAVRRAAVEQLRANASSGRLNLGSDVPVPFKSL